MQASLRYLCIIGRFCFRTVCSFILLTVEEMKISIRAGAEESIEIFGVRNAYTLAGSFADSAGCGWRNIKCAAVKYNCAQLPVS